MTCRDELSHAMSRIATTGPRVDNLQSYRRRGRAPTKRLGIRLTAFPCGAPNELTLSCKSRPPRGAHRGVVAAATERASEGAKCGCHAAVQFRAARGGSAAGPTGRRFCQLVRVVGQLDSSRNPCNVLLNDMPPSCIFGKCVIAGMSAEWPTRELHVNESSGTGNIEAYARQRYVCGDSATGTELLPSIARLVGVVERLQRDRVHIGWERSGLNENGLGILQ